MLDLLRNLEDRFSHIIISDSEDDIDVVTIDESADKLVKTPGELITPIGIQNKVQNFTYILNRPNDSVSVKLSSTEVAAILETPAKRKRLNRTLDGIDNVFINAVNSARMTGYHPLHDHNYCMPSIIRTVREWNSDRKQHKKALKKSTEIQGSTKSNCKSQKQSKTASEGHFKSKTASEGHSMSNTASKGHSKSKTASEGHSKSKTASEGCSSVEMPPMVMLLPTLNVPIVLSKTGGETDMDSSSSDKQIVESDNHNYMVEKPKARFSEGKQRKRVRDDKTHNILERRRRRDLRELYQRLRKLIPELEGKDTASKAAILIQACRYITDLQEEFSYKARHLRELQLENRSLSVSLNDLKRIYLKEGLLR